MTKRNKFVLLGIFILLAVPSYLIALKTIKSTAEKQLTKMTHYEANIKNLSLSIFPLALKIKGFSLKKKGKKFSIGKIEIYLRPLSLLKKEININKIIINKVDSTIFQKNSFIPLGFEKIKPDAKKISSDKKSSKFDWSVVIDDFQITNTSLKINLIDNTKKIIVLKHVHLEDFYFFKEKVKAKLKVDLNLEHSSIILKNSLSFLKEKQEIQTNYNISKLDLSLLKIVAQITKSNIPTVSGLLSLKGDMHLIKKQKKINIQGLSGIELKDFTVISKNQKTIDYFIKHLKVKKAQYKLNKKLLDINISSIKIMNPIFSTTLQSFSKKKKHFSKFAQINLKNIQLSSNLGKNTDLNFKSTYQTKGAIKISSKGNMDSKKMKIDITGFDLTPLSEALEDSLRYSIVSGALNFKYNTQTDKTHIKGNALTTISQLALSNQNERGGEIKNDSFFPLATAISLIKNDNGKIEIESAISGKKDDPNFSFYKMLRNGIGGILINHFSKIVAQKAAQQFFPLLLQSVPFNPAGALMLLEGGYKFIKKPRFKSVSFAIRKSDLIKKEKKHLDKVITFLKKSQSLSLNFCPEASLSEKLKESKRGAMDLDTALELAKSRIDVVKKYILKGSGVKAEQVIFCRPSIKKETIHRPELLIYL